MSMSPFEGVGGFNQDPSSTPGQEDAEVLQVIHAQLVLRVEQAVYLDRTADEARKGMVGEPLSVVAGRFAPKFEDPEVMPDPYCELMLLPNSGSHTDWTLETIVVRHPIDLEADGPGITLLSTDTIFLELFSRGGDSARYVLTEGQGDLIPYLDGHNIRASDHIMANGLKLRSYVADEESTNLPDLSPAQLKGMLDECTLAQHYA